MQTQVIRGYLSYVPQQYGATLATATPLVGTLNADGVTVTARMTGVVKCV